MCKGDKRKGFALAKVLIETLLVAIVVVSVTRLVSHFVEVSNNESIRQGSVISNTSLAELVKKMSRSGADVNALSEMKIERRDYVSEVTEIEEVGSSGGTSLVRVTIDSKYRGDYVFGTRLIIYVSSKI